MQQLPLTKYTKPALYVVGAIVAVAILFFVYRLFSRVSSGAKAAAGIAADKVENEAVAHEAGISASHVDELRNAAYKVADELETRKGRGWLDNAFHITNIEAVVNALNVAKSTGEMSVIKNFYAKLFTDNNSLYNDVNDRLPALWTSKITYRAAMQ